MGNEFKNCYSHLRYYNFNWNIILRRLGGGDAAYYTSFEEPYNDANKNSALI